MSFTPYNAPLLAGLLGDHEIASFFSVKAELAAMIEFEITLAHAQAEHGLIPEKAAQAITEALSNFEPDVRALSGTTARDGTVGPGFVAQAREAVGNPLGEHLHFGATSQDVTDTSAMMRLRNCLAVLETRLARINNGLDALREEQGTVPLMARTRMQSAMPFTLADKISNWLGPLDTLRDEVPKRFPLQLGGPNGTLDKMGDLGLNVAVEMAQNLDLTCPSRHWQTDRMAMVEIANWLSMLTGALGKMGQDIALMGQNEVAEITFSGGGTSSAMPHKSNPVQAEALVTLARFNAAQVSLMHQALVHENERSGAAWMLEWMVMPQMAVAAGAATRNAELVLGHVTFGVG